MLRQPIVQFLLLGLVIYLAYLLSGAGTDREDTIVVTKDRLLVFMQYRSQAFDAERATQAFSELGDEALGRLVQDYVREEVLYREAKSLGLDVGDYIIRQRLVQKMEFLVDEQAPVTLAEEDIAAFFADHREDYLQPGTVSFSHVFFRGEDDGESRALLAAGTGELTVEQALQLGDRFPYHRNYSKADRNEITGHFGSAFADRLFQLEPGRWQGPLVSAYGTHLVYVLARTEGRYPSLDEVHAKVADDLARQRRQDQLAAAVNELAGRYEIVEAY